MKNRAAVMRRTAIRQTDSGHAYRLTPNEWTMTGSPKPTKSTWNTLSADEIFPSDSRSQSARPLVHRSEENQT